MAPALFALSETSDFDAAGREIRVCSGTARDDSFLSDANVSIDSIGETGFIKMAQIHSII